MKRISLNGEKTICTSEFNTLENPEKIEAEKKYFFRKNEYKERTVYLNNLFSKMICGKCL
jgi:hypothetical protein